MSEKPVTADTLRAEVERLLSEAFALAKDEEPNDPVFTAALTIAHREVDSALQPFLQQQAAVVAERDRLRRQVEKDQSRCYCCESYGCGPGCECSQLPRRLPYKEA